MSRPGTFKEKCRAFWEGSRPARRTIAAIFTGIGKVFKFIGSWIYRLRSIFLAAPVAIAALRLAAYNQEHLPEMVGIDLQATGQYAQMIERDTVVFWPLVLTAACLLLMFCSRRIIYPWIISIFTLVVPILIYVTNIFPA